MSEKTNNSTGLFGVHELYSLEINPSENIFKVNGEDFGNRCWEYEIKICQKDGEICVSFYRDGRTRFKNTYNVRTGGLKNHSETIDCDYEAELKEFREKIDNIF